MRRGVSHAGSRPFVARVGGRVATLVGLPAGSPHARENKVGRAGHFRVDPRLATLLGEGYRSSEEALRELVDNAWDAESENVTITLPRELTTDPVIVADDGAGMTEKEVREEYLLIARGRQSRKGERTPNKQRRVKGRKGIGKFAGLMVADEMKVETKSRGRVTRVTITKAYLLSAAKDLEAIDLPVDAADCDPAERGTTIVLSGLAQNLAFPSAERLKQILVAEYLRQNDFRVVVNGDPIAIEDIPGRTVEEQLPVATGQEAKITFTIGDGNKPVKNHGFSIRVGGKVVGRPTMLGLENDETIPQKLLKRVVGEIEADGLEGDVTGDGGSIVENSKAFQQLQEIARELVKREMTETYKTEINLQKARLTQQVKRRLALLPENRRRAADEAVQRILHKFYNDAPEKIDVVVSVMLEAFEGDEYWTVLKEINASTRADVGKLADALDEFGLVDLAVVAHQARSRLRFLDELEALAKNDATLEAQMHHAIANNLWCLGRDFGLIASNRTLRALLSDWADKEFSGPRATTRPDLFLAEDLREKLVLIEFKRPGHAINRDDESQAIKYRDDLSSHGDRPIEIVLIGKGRAASVSSRYGADELKVLSYVALISSARRELEWLVTQLGGAPPRGDVGGA